MATLSEHIQAKSEEQHGMAHVATVDEHKPQPATLSSVNTNDINFRLLVKKHLQLQP